MTVEAAIAVIVHRGRILIRRRPQRSFLGGLWEFPGGKRRPGEAWQACLRREVREETGMTITDIIPYMTLRHSYHDRRLIGRVFRCRPGAGSAIPRATMRQQWVYPAALQGFKFPAANRRLLARLRALSGRTPHAIIAVGQGGTA
jgi:mutator protein MutT